MNEGTGGKIVKISKEIRAEARRELREGGKMKRIGRAQGKKKYDREENPGGGGGGGKKKIKKKKKKTSRQKN